MRDSSYDSKGVVSDIYKYSSWTSSYSKNYFKGGYSWSETISGYDSESTTKRAVYTSNGSSWSWTRSGTVWDDGRNDWSESWSKSSWKDGKYLPSESESKRGGFDPKKTTPQVNDVPKFGDLPRLTKAPKGKDVPPDLWQINKPSKNIWTPPSRTVKEPQFKDVIFGGSGKDDLANNPSGGSGQPDVRNMTFIQKLKAAILLVPGLLVGDAKAIFQQLISDPEFIAELIGVGVVFAALQAIPGVGQAIDAALIIAFGLSAGFNLGSFFLNTFKAQDKQGLQAAANNFKNFIEAVGALALIGALKLAGRFLSSIRRGSSLSSPAPLQFGSNDLVYGPSAGGRLRALADRAGGVTLTNLNKPVELTWPQFSIRTLNEAAASGRKIRFDLTHMEDILGILNNTGKYADTTTAIELRYIRANWVKFNNLVHFYVNDIEVSPPWPNN